MNQILFLLIGFAAGIVITWIIRKFSFERDHVSKQQFQTVEKQLNDVLLEKGRIEERNDRLMKSEEEFKAKLLNVEGLVKESDRLLIQTQSDNKNLLEKLDTQKTELEQIGRKFETEFKLLASNILEEKTKSFNTMQETSLKTILDPLKINIKEFKEEFESKLNNEAKEKGSLSQQIKQMMELNQNLSAQADNLTKALSNNVKQQGDWGEEILESILEYAGLQKNIQYFIQPTTQNDDGSTIRPDVLVKYPDGRAIVIDSKVTLVHHTRYCAAATTEEQSLYLGQSINALKLHVDGLSRKNYQDITEALDFVMMFVPNEAAYISAMYADHELWQYAYKKRVILLSPTNLIPAMKLIADMWQKDAIGKNAIQIAEKAGKIYDKLVGFVENFEKVGAQIEKANTTWIEAQKQLSKGKGNLISQAEQMKQLHLKTSKQLSEKVIQEALLEDGIDDGIENN